MGYRQDGFRSSIKTVFSKALLFPDFGLDNWFNLLKSPAISGFLFFARDQRFICASRFLASINV